MFVAGLLRRDGGGGNEGVWGRGIEGRDYELETEVVSQVDQVKTEKKRV